MNFYMSKYEHILNAIGQCFFITSFWLFFFFWHCALTAKTLTKKTQEVNEIAEGLHPPRSG